MRTQCSSTYIHTLGAVASTRMGRRSVQFEAPPQPAPEPVVVDNSRTRDLRVAGFPQQSTTAAVPVATIAVPENQASEANDIFRRMRRSDKRRRAEQ